MAITAIPILPVKDTSANGFTGLRLIEELTQTFKTGTPVIITAADGGIAAWGGSTGTAFTYTTANRQGGICGISYEAASNLSATGLGAPVPFQPVVGLGAAVGTFGSVPNQSAAKNIAHGAPINDGRVGLILPGPNVVFSAVFGNAGNTATPANTDVGLSYGLTVDTGGNFWYVDKSKATPGTNTVVIIVGLDPRDAPAAGTRVLFQFDPRFIDPTLLG
jgi:hypothetical protein